MNCEAEERRFRYAESNRRIGSVTRDLLLGSICPEGCSGPAAPLLRAMGFPTPSRWVRHTVTFAMQLRRKLLPLLPPRRRPRWLIEVGRPTYPEGYRVEELGTFRSAGTPWT